MLRHLSEYFHADRLTLIKKSLFELYENMLVIETIESFKKKEKKRKVSFITVKEILRLERQWVRNLAHLTLFICQVLGRVGLGVWYLTYEAW